jgi:hypothetical protein
VAGVVVDAELVLDHLGDAAARPQGPDEAVGLGPSLQKRGQVPALLVGQAAALTPSRPRTKRLQAIARRPRQPLADGRLGDAQGLGD